MQPQNARQFEQNGRYQAVMRNCTNGRDNQGSYSNRNRAQAQANMAANMEDSMDED